MIMWVRWLIVCVRWLIMCVRWLIMCVRWMIVCVRWMIVCVRCMIVCVRWMIVCVHLEARSRNALALIPCKVQVNFITKTKGRHRLLKNGFWDTQIAQGADSHVAADS
jgi:hypothetical protein